jgi:hypothetical protein
MGCTTLLIGLVRPPLYHIFLSLPHHRDSSITKVNDVNTSRQSNQSKSLLIIMSTQPAASLLKPGYSPPRPVIAESIEKGILKSSRFLRLLAACFIASFPFLIPPFVSCSSTLQSELIGCSSSLNMVSLCERYNESSS